MSEIINSPGVRKVNWINAVTQLCGNVEEWARDEGWDVSREDKKITESQIGTYLIPRLTVFHPGGRLYVEPVGACILGGEGRVDLESYPTLNSLLLIWEKEQWVVYTDSRVPWPDKWGRDCFKNIVEALQH